MCGAAWYDSLDYCSGVGSVGVGAGAAVSEVDSSGGG